MRGETPLLQLRLHRVEYAATGVYLLELRWPEGGELPAFSAGSHVDLHLPNGLVRQYSLANAPRERTHYLLGVKRDPKSRGGSVSIHDDLRVGQLLTVSLPRNHFPLDEEAPVSVFVAGGIGITPIASMVQHLKWLGHSWQLHYSVRTRDDAALLDRVAGAGLQLHVDAEAGALLDIGAVLAAAPADAPLYCCGPAPMLDAFEAAAKALPGRRWTVERFAAAAPSASSGGFTVRLAATGRTLPVAAGQSILDALRGAGLSVRASCEQGICGTCETRVLGGTPDHRDSLLSDEEKRTNEVMMICCSGSLSEELVLDL